MRAAITGASGHLGAHLAACLLESGHPVLAIVRPDSDTRRLAAISPKVEILRTELGELDCADLRKFAPDVMFHLAWAGVTSDVRNRESLILENIRASLAVLTAALNAGCSAWIGVGSQAEYGWYEGKLSEDSACRPATLYGATKLAVSQIVRTLCDLNQVRFVWFRLFAVYGPEDDPRHLIPAVIESYLEGREPSLTAGEQMWDYLYVRDAAAALMTAAARPGISGTYNLASGVPIRIAELVQRIHSAIAPACGSGLGAKPYAPDQIMLLQADTSRWLSASGLSLSTDLSVGLERTISWHRSRKTFNS